MIVLLLVIIFDVLNARLACLFCSFRKAFVLMTLNLDLSKYLVQGSNFQRSYVCMYLNKKISDREVILAASKEIAIITSFLQFFLLSSN